LTKIQLSVNLKSREFSTRRERVLTMGSGQMDLVERKLKILQAIITDFIDTAQPIGSRTIAKKYDLGISSATIRNEMADLEEMGYLVQPHTSAGRIPSDLGYRVYVDNLMQLYEIANKQKQIIRELLFNKIIEMDELLHQASLLLSQLTNLTSIGLSPQFKKSRIKNIKLIQIDEKKVLLVLVSNTGIVKNIILRSDGICQNTLDRISNLLQIELKNLTIEDINDEVINKLKKQIFEYEATIDRLIPVLKDTFREIEGVDLYCDGITNIFDLPEYTDVNKAKQFLSTIEKKDLMIKLLLNNRDDDICIKIGSENSLEEVKDCSIITATYKLNGKTIGSIGVIGPTRMDYSKVIPTIKCITNTLTEIFTNNY